VTQPLKLHLKSNFFFVVVHYHFVFLDLLPGLQPGLATSCKSSESIPDNVLTSEAVTISYIRSC
jgi:hypothetical protein